MAEIAQANSPSLAELYFECIDSFAKFVLALSEPDCDAICRDEVRLPQIFEEYGRTKIWGDQSKADLPARVRGSLDDILRHDNDLKSLVRGILQRLKVLLEQATHIAQRKYNPGRDTDQDSISSVSDSDYSTDNEDESQRRKMPKVRLFVQQIADQIRSLHEISSLLRRPTVTNKFIRSINVGLEATTLQGLGNLHLNGAFGLFDDNHIIEKVLQWRGLAKSLKGVKFSDEDVARVSNALIHREIEDIRWFCQRLARANTRRREQLWYWKNHPYDPKQIATSANLVGDLGITRGIVPLEGQKEDSRSQVSTLKPPDPHILHSIPKSVLSKQSFSTVALSDVHDTGTNTRPRTIYAPTAIGQDRTISVPGPPRTKDGEMTFPCPYCGMALESKDMNRQLWKRHVFRDLRPYICTFEHCHNAEKLFSSRHEWKHHEFQIHRREYVCQRCQNRCASRREMSTHLQEHYGDSIPSAQMDIILDLCNRQVDPSDKNTEACILCREDISLSAWHDHVAAHMENLSLFVLPAPENDEEETEGSIISGKAEVLDSNDESTGSVSKASSLRFSAAGDHGQTTAEFAKIIAYKEVGYTSKLSTWKATDEDNITILNTESQIKPDPGSLIEEFEELRKTLEQNMQTAKRDNSLKRMNVLISNLYERMPIQDERWEQMQLDVIELSRMLLSKTHPSTLTTMANLALTYYDQGRWKEAESLEVHVMETRKTVLGPDHPDTLTSMDNLALTYRSQGRLNEAESLAVQVMETRKTVLGPDHTDTLTSMDNLALIYRSQGRLYDAESLAVQVMETRKTVLGPDHPDTLAGMANLALVYRNHGRLQDAEAMYEQALRGYEKALGPEHILTLNTVNNLGNLYKHQGRYQDAEDMYERALAGYEKVLGPEQTLALNTVNNLGNLYKHQGRYQDAEDMYKRALAGKEHALG
ncbi:hypothetical protein HD806DRAFT_511072 [Xylariaceae sp. AK1471]|nr:hypothetical protein HD806DRAFT_511072 [Xylariaceae sp. AK1471]